MVLRSHLTFVRKDYRSRAQQGGRRAALRFSAQPLMSAISCRNRDARLVGQPSSSSGSPHFVTFVTQGPHLQSAVMAIFKKPPATVAGKFRYISMCQNCGGVGWVCENHPDQPWEAASNRVDACGCGKGMPCAKCNTNESPEARWEK